ncbi:BPSL0761 family protein [Geopseudomonas aromaticivorans]
MTMVDERTRSVVQTSDFLRELAGDPALPEAIRMQAKRLLRHYPAAVDIWRACAVEERLRGLLEEESLPPEVRCLLLHEPLFCDARPAGGQVPSGG